MAFGVKRGQFAWATSLAEGNAEQRQTIRYRHADCVVVVIVAVDADGLAALGHYRSDQPCYYDAVLD